MRQKRLVGSAILLIMALYLAVLFGHSRPVQKLPIKTLDPWILQSNDPDAITNKSGVNQQDQYPYGIYLGNGDIGARIGPEGVGKVGPCLLAGCYENEGLKGLPIWSDFPLYDSDGKRFELDKTAPYRQTLNMKEGYVETELTLKSGRQKLVGKVTFFITPRNVAVIRYDLVSNWNGNVGVDKPKQPTGTSVDVLVSDADGNQIGGNQPVSAGSLVALCKYVVVSPIERNALMPKPEEFAKKIGYDKLLSDHKKYWTNQWKSDIVIDGDPAAQQAIHAMMFYLLSSGDSLHSIPPTGLSSGAWRGHIFWDADVWMFPALLLQHPDSAGGIVFYRYVTSTEAAENARKRGLKGTEFAWESAQTGRETIGKPFSEERHVTADAVSAATTWVTAIKSSQLSRIDWVEKQLLPQTADYWVSRSTYNKAKDRYEILNVVSPDEDADIVNNSAYTNAAARRNIELAIAAARKTGRPVPPKWVEVAKKMFIPFDAKNKRFFEYDGYKDQVTKQADTELLIYPLCYPMSDEVKKNTFDFYKTKTNPRGPAMTSSIHAIIAAELGRPQEAYDHFAESYTDFLRGPFLIFNEKRSKTLDNACFVTGCGGSIQSVLYGFAGLRIGNNPGGFAKLLPDLYIKPCLPPKWKKLQIKNLQWQGKPYDLMVSPGNKWDLKKR